MNQKIEIPFFATTVKDGGPALHFRAFSAHAGDFYAGSGAPFLFKLPDLLFKVAGHKEDVVRS
jgi:hypothetical protein